MEKINISDLRPTEEGGWSDKDGNCFFLREGQTVDEFVDEVNWDADVAAAELDNYAIDNPDDPLPPPPLSEVDQLRLEIGELKKLISLSK